MKFLKKLRRLQCKLEITIAAISLGIIVVDIFSGHKSLLITIIADFYNKINADEKNSDLVAFIAITIGIYISIITILSTSRIPASEEILKNHLEVKIINFVFLAVSTNILDIIYILFVPKFVYYELIYFALLIPQITFLIKFMIFILLLCKVNVNAVINEIDSEQSEKERVYNLLCNIRDKID